MIQLFLKSTQSYESWMFFDAAESRCQQQETNLLRLHFSKTIQFSWNASKTWFNAREPSFRGRSYKVLRIYRIWSFGGVKNYIGAAAAVAQWKSARLAIVGSNPVSSQCFETFTRLYSQVCKYRSIFKITSVLKFTAQVYFKFSI